MAMPSSASATARMLTVPALLLLLSSAALLVFLILPSLSPSPAAHLCACSPPTTTHTTTTVTTTTTTASPAPVTTSPADVAWLKSQLASNSLPLLASHDAWHRLRKGINPRTREQQLFDINRHHGISHYPDEEATNHTALPCPGELLVEEHHSNYGEPWAGGRDVFEFLANASALTPRDQVLEIGCGTLRVSLHFIRFLEAAKFHCLERDELSLMAALRYELPAQGLLYKRPMIVRGEDMDFSRFGDTVMYDLIYASAVFLHIPDKLVWTGLERLAGKLRPQRGRIFVSHNIKFCSRLGGDECTRRLTELGLEYVGKHTHDSLLFNHYEIWWQHHTPELVQDKTAEEEEEEEAEAEGWPSPSEAEEIAAAGAGDPLERVLLLYLDGSV
uniref:Methyltransferase type 12 domain-containing protein n=1 Tax=Oryza nivara TaxID=4536 RepID=A0A0E0I5E0_ORYNI